MSGQQNVSQCFEEERKPRKAMGGIQNLRTPMKARIRSKPKIEGQEFLDMYSLTRDRARWERMKDQSGDTLREIAKEMHKTSRDSPLIQALKDQEKPDEQAVAPAAGHRLTKPMQKVSLDY